jgi:hypothetical protein
LHGYDSLLTMITAMLIITMTTITWYREDCDCYADNDDLVDSYNDNDSDGNIDADDDDDDNAIDDSDDDNNYDDNNDNGVDDDDDNDDEANQTHPVQRISQRGCGLLKTHL